ncbi:borealin-like [Condylostylus longicornis]|uniref:borealin-like n=1 Tax=Condylostylus longicornis TaxID=2530218 RepID=UPI00244DAB64|nr:borealin-like [Condylostylus longicornis]
MPRTKISKAKRNRDAAKDEREEIKNERLRQFDNLWDQIEEEWICSYNSLIEEFNAKRNMLKLQLTPKELSMKLYDNMNGNDQEQIAKVDSKNVSTSSISSLAPTSSVLSASSCISKKSNDEGYLTEDSGNARNSNLLRLPTIPTHMGRTPGPLSSAKARPRMRRSRSATGTINSAQKNQTTSITSEHNSRSKLRTPLLQQKSSARAKAVSADRISALVSNINSDASPILRRWARPGETIISLSGSPIVIPMIPDSFANVNIPTKSGTFSLRSKKLDSTEIGKMIAENLSPETLMEMKQLQANLNVIMSHADKNF